MTNTRGFRKGLTMIELLVSVTIFLVVLLAIYQLFETSHATYESGTRKQDVQQQARLAMDEMVRVLRMAGYVSENYDTTVGNEITNSLRIHLATENFLAAFGNLDQSAYIAGPPVVPASHVFVFCRPNGTNTLLVKRSTDPTNVLTYSCNATNTTYVASGVQHEIRSDVLADNVTNLQFSYLDVNGGRVVGTQILPGPPAIHSLDNQTLGTAANLGTGAARAERESIRTIVITFQITETVPRQQPQVYNLTSTVRLRNLNNT